MRLNLLTALNNLLVIKFY